MPSGGGGALTPSARGARGHGYPSLTWRGTCPAPRNSVRTARPSGSTEIKQLGQNIQGLAARSRPARTLNATS